MLCITSNISCGYFSDFSCVPFLSEFSKILISCESKGAEFFELHNELPDITLIKDKLFIQQIISTKLILQINILKIMILILIQDIH